MKIAICLVFCLAIGAFAMAPKKINHAQKEQFETLRNSKTWAGFFLKMAEVQVMTGGPLDELVLAIQDAQIDLAAKRTRADNNFQDRTNQHNALVTRLEGDIVNTETEIEQIRNVLSLLAEEKANLEEDNARLNTENANLRQHIIDATKRREIEHETFETHVIETNEGLAAVDECLTLLHELQSGGASFAQVKKAQTQLTQIHSKLAKSSMVDAHILLALIEMTAQQEFADASAIAQVISKFNEIRDNLVNSLNQLSANEQKDQADFEDDIKDSNANINTNNLAINENNEGLARNAQNTTDNNNLLAQRQQDLVNLNNELDAENESYANDKAIYEDLVAQFEAEANACAQALEVLATADFSDYISDRVTAEDGLVSSGMRNAQQHGQGGEVFNFDYDQF